MTRTLEQPSSGPIDIEALSSQASEYKQLISAVAANNVRESANQQADPHAAARAAAALLSAGGGSGAQQDMVNMANPQDVLRMLEEEMDIDMDLLRKGVVRKGQNSRSKNKARTAAFSFWCRRILM